MSSGNGTCEKLLQKKARILVVGSGPTGRSIIIPVLKNIGFSDVSFDSTFQNAAFRLQSELFDLVIITDIVKATHALVNGKKTAISSMEKSHAYDIYKPTIDFIDGCASGKYRKTIHGSIVMVACMKTDYRFLPLAYKHGLIAHYNPSNIHKANFSDVIVSFLSVLTQYHSDEKSVALHNLRRLMQDDLFRDYCDFESMEKITRTLLKRNHEKHYLFPILIESLCRQSKLAEAKSIMEAIPHARLTGAMIEDLDDLSREFGLKTIAGDSIPKESLAKIHGLRNVAIIDPDTQSSNLISEELKRLGAETFSVYKIPEMLVEDLKTGKKFECFISEWRFSQGSISGPALIQRLRRSFPESFILIHSGQVQEKDFTLLHELGLGHSVLKKPIGNRDIEAFLSIRIKERWDPKNAGATLEAIMIAGDLGREKEAESLFQKLLTQEPKAYEAAIAHAIVLITKLKFADSIRVLKPFLQAHDRHAQVYSLLGKAFLKLKDYKSAMVCLAKASSLSPGNVERNCEMSRIAMEEGDAEASEKHLKAALIADPSSRLVEETKSYVYSVKASLEGGTLPPGPTTRAFVSSQNARIVTLARTGRESDALDLYERLLGMIDDSDAYVVSSLKYNKSIAHLRKGEQTDALSILSEIDLSTLSKDNRSMATKVYALFKKVSEKESAGEKYELQESDEMSSIRTSTDFMAMRTELLTVITDSNGRDAVPEGIGLRGLYHPGTK